METASACQLFNRCLDRRGGDEWREFHRRYNPRVRRTVLRAFLRGGVPLVDSELDEFVQDLYCRLLTTGAREFRGRTESQLWTYLDRVAHSVALDHRRATQATKRQPQAPVAGRATGRDHPAQDRQGHDLRGRERPCSGRPRRSGPPESIEEMAARQVSPEERCLINEYRRILFARCRKLSRNDRTMTVLRLAVLEDWSSPEISRRLDGAMTPNQIDLVVHRLRRRLAEEGIRLPDRRRGQKSPS